jgi:hypothetical protein
MWSPPPESNRRPHPYHGCALPTELGGRWSIIAGQRLFSVAPTWMCSCDSAAIWRQPPPRRMLPNTAAGRECTRPHPVPGRLLRSASSIHGLADQRKHQMHRSAGPLRRVAATGNLVLRMGRRGQSTSCRQMFSRIARQGGNRMCRHSSASLTCVGAAAHRSRPQPRLRRPPGPRRALPRWRA